LEALWKLLQRPWFARRWVVPEIAAARKTTLQCGTQSVDWYDFAMIIEVLRESSRAVSYQPAINGPDQHLRIPAWLENFDAFNASALVHTIPLSRREYTVVDKGSSAFSAP
jgi:hypothetical protein